MLNPPSSPAGADRPADEKGRPLMALTGTDSGVAERSYHRVDNDEQWAELWEQHRSPEAWEHPRPQVDFDRCTLVAVFEGTCTHRSAMEIASVTETAGEVVVRFDFPGYATGIGVEAPEVQPFGLILLPRTDKPVVLEQDATGGNKSVSAEPEVDGGGAPQDVAKWHEVARLEPGAE